MANTEKEKRDSITSNPIKREKKQLKEKREKRKIRYSNISKKHLIMMEILIEITRMTIHPANHDDNAIKSVRDKAQKRMTRH